MPSMTRVVGGYTPLRLLPVDMSHNYFTLISLINVSVCSSQYKELRASEERNDGTIPVRSDSLAPVKVLESRGERERGAGGGGGAHLPLGTGVVCTVHRYTSD